MNLTSTQFHGIPISISLSKLLPTKRNPRKVKPERDAHRQKVASIRAFGLIQPLVVRADDKEAGSYRVLVGNGRLAALKDAYKDVARPPKIPCILRDVDDDTAAAMQLAENVIRTAMHPLDESEAYAGLARDEGKGAEAIAAQFGVTAHYVRQRIKLATLADPIKAAYRQNGIDTGTAEAFASVPPERQLEVWQEVGGKPQDAAEGFALSAHQVRRIIAHAWIDARAATFDISKLPESAVSADLFAERTLIERKAFMEAQADALLIEQKALTEEGWSNVVITPRGDAQDRLMSMDGAPQEYDELTTRKLKKLHDKRSKLEAKFADLDDDNDSDNIKSEAMSAELELLDDEERQITQDAPVHYAEATKAVGSVFLILDPDGQVRREYRVSRSRQTTSAGGNGQSGAGPVQPPKPPTADDLKDAQLATTFTHQAIGVRNALLKDSPARKRVLALILHENVRSEALAIRHEANETTVCADHTEGFASTALDAMRQRRAESDPLYDKHYVDDEVAYDAMKALPDKQVNALIDLLTVQLLTAHLKRKTDLVWLLAQELGVNIRRYWRPDEKWLACYQKIQLASLIVELRGAVYAPAETKKKSELVTELATLFADAAKGRLEDATLAAKLNEWLPSNLREEPATSAEEVASPDEANASAA